MEEFEYVERRVEGDGILSKVPSGYLGKTPESILVVDDLLSQDEIDRLLYAAKNLNIWDESSPFRNKYTTEDILKEKSPETLELINDITQRWQDKISKFYDNPIKANNCYMCKWPVGGYQNPHADREWHDGTPAEQNYYDIGSVIYLNDDYDSGELYFVQHNMTYKPVAGGAIAFPGDKYHMHGVNKVETKERYTIPIFWTITEYDPSKDKSGI